MNLNLEEWQEFRFGDLLSEIYKAKVYKDEDLVFSTQLNSATVPYVTRTEINNGVKAFVIKDGLPTIENGNALVIGDTTATVSYQKTPFITGDHIVVIRADWLNEFTGLFVTTVLKKEKYRYSYGRAFKIDTISETRIKLPVTECGIPDWEFMESFIKSLNYKTITTKIKSNTPNLKIDKWKQFRVGDLFKLQIGKANNGMLSDGTDCFYLGAKKNNNGIMRTCAYDKDLIQKGNCIVFICNGQGSVGYTNYMDKDFIATTDLVIGYNDYLNKYIGMFLVTVLDLERPRYSFGRKWKTHLADTIVSLPATSDGEPDYVYMENYIKSLSYSDRI